ncbi:MAG: DUF1801 domain-containing protein [Bacteroidia bacterium]|nr:DUF1801 domain-containing protein [Bacteroidia bacterium]
MDQLQQIYLKQEEPNHSCLLALRTIILEMDPDVSETIKYGMPCFCYKQKMFCYLWTDKKSSLPYVLFVEGKHLNHPLLESGDRTRMKTFTINPNEDIPIDSLSTLLNQALDLYRNGTLKTK